METLSKKKSPKKGSFWDDVPLSPDPSELKAVNDLVKAVRGVRKPSSPNPFIRIIFRSIIISPLVLQ